MRKVVLLVVVLMAVALIGTAIAVPPGKTVEFDTPMGKVVFDGSKHKEAGQGCMNCHPKIFQMKKGSAEMKAPHKDTFCATCHNGEKAFITTGNCQKCHKK